MRSKQDKVEDGITSVGIGALGAGIIYAFIRPFLARKQAGEDLSIPAGEVPTGETTFTEAPGALPAAPPSEVPASPVEATYVPVAPADPRAMEWGTGSESPSDLSQPIMQNGAAIGYQNPYLDYSNPYEVMPEDATLVARYGGTVEEARAEWLRRWNLKHRG